MVVEALKVYTFQGQNLFRGQIFVVSILYWHLSIESWTFIHVHTCCGGLLIRRTLVGEREKTCYQISKWRVIGIPLTISTLFSSGSDRNVPAALTTVTDIHAPDNNPVNQSISSIGSTYITNSASPRNIYLTKQVEGNISYNIIWLPSIKRWYWGSFWWFIVVP